MNEALHKIIKQERDRWYTIMYDQLKEKNELRLVIGALADAHTKAANDNNAEHTVELFTLHDRYILELADLEQHIAESEAMYNELTAIERRLSNDTI